MLFKKFVYILLLPIFLGACTQVPRDGDFATVRKLVDDRIDQDIHWYQGEADDETVRENLGNLLKQPLTATSAVQIALLNNSRLQSEYESLGIAQADLVKAGLLSNPVLFSSIRFPKGGDGGNNIEFSLAKDFLDILLRPARKRVAAAEFEKTKFRVANSILELANDVQKAYYRVLGLKHLQSVMQLASQAAENSYQLANRYDEAGNISELMLAQERSAAAEMSMETLRSGLTVENASNELYRLLGVSGDSITWPEESRLPEMSENEPGADQMVKLALEQRLESSIASKEIEQLQQALDMTRDFRWIGGAEVGVSTERDPDGTRVTGPSFSVEVPLFDQRQADIARLESLLKQSQHRQTALQSEIRNDIESALARINSSREMIRFYRDELLPAREQVVMFTQQEQNYMLTDVFELLFARQQQILAYRHYIESLTDYWIAKIDLARATGSGLILVSKNGGN